MKAVGKSAIVLAGGKGKRMGLPYPKVLYPFRGKPILRWLLETLDEIGLRKIVLVVGFQAEKVKEAVKKFSLRTPLEFALQRKQLGTGHAVKCTENNFVGQNEDILVAYGDMPFWSQKTIKEMFRLHQEKKATITLAVTKLPKQFAYGRVIIEEGKVKAIVEEKDCSPEQLKIKKKNAGLYVFEGTWLFANLGKLSRENAQGEYYLTDMVEIAVRQHRRVLPYFLKNPYEAIGINTPEDIKIAQEKIPALSGD